MSRAQFNTDQVVEDAMQLFWQQGYSGASMQDVSAATGLKPGSIYLAFGNKDGLYRAAMERYADQSIEFINLTVEQAGEADKGICMVLNEMVEQAIPKNFYSCFLVRSRLELPQSNSLHQFAGELLHKVEECFASHLACFVSEDDVKAYASTLMIHIFGIRVYGYHSNAQATLTETLRVSLPWLPWQTS